MNELEVQTVISLPLVCTRGVIVFPSQDIIIDVGREKSIQAIEEAQQHHDGNVVLVAQRDLSMEEPKVNELYSFGSLCKIKHIRRMDGFLRVKFHWI